MSDLHPCPKPTLTRRHKLALDGMMWACACGRVFVIRFRFNYAGEWWEFVPTTLRAEEVPA